MKPKRKAIPDRIKLIVTLRRFGLTTADVEFDHNPAIELRPINEEGTDYEPPQLDPDHIDMLLIAEHDRKTFGPGGEKRITTAGSDIGNIKKMRHITADEEAFRRKMLAKVGIEPPEAAPKKKRKHKWASRPFPKRPKP